MTYVLQYVIIGEGYNNNHTCSEDEIHRLYDIVMLLAMHLDEDGTLSIPLSIPFYVQKYPQQGHLPAYYFSDGISSYVQRQERDTDLVLNLSCTGLTVEEMLEGLVRRLEAHGIGEARSMIQKRWRDFCR